MIMVLGRRWCSHYRHFFINSMTLLNGAWATNFRVFSIYVSLRLFFGFICPNKNTHAPVLCGISISILEVKWSLSGQRCILGLPALALPILKCNKHTLFGSIVNINILSTHIIITSVLMNTLCVSAS